MAVNYPGSLDSFTNPSATDEMDDAGFEHDVLHSDAFDAIEALEAKLGIGASDPSTKPYFSVLQTRDDGSGGYETVWEPVVFPDGSAASPSIRFANDADLGLYRIGTNNIGVSVGGTNIIQFRALSDGSFPTVALADDGSAANPVLTFDGDEDTGLYRGNADNINFAVGGSALFRMDPGGIRSYLNGTAALPAYSFDAQPDTGIFLSEPFGFGSLNFAADGQEIISVREQDVIVNRNISFPNGGATDNIVYGMTARAEDGTVGTPSISFQQDQDLGLYRSATDIMSVTAGGNEVARFLSGGLEMPSDTLITLAGDTGWTDVTFENGWANFDSSWMSGQYKKTADGFVHLRGMISSGTAGATAFTLPSGYRPLERTMVIAQANSGSCRVDIISDGTVRPRVVDGPGDPNTWVTLEGISFSVQPD